METTLKGRKAIKKPRRAEGKDTLRDEAYYKKRDQYFQRLLESNEKYQKYTAAMNTVLEEKARLKAENPDSEEYKKIKAVATNLKGEFESQYQAIRKQFNQKYKKYFREKAYAAEQGGGRGTLALTSKNLTSENYQALVPIVNQFANRPPELSPYLDELLSSQQGKQGKGKKVSFMEKIQPNAMKNLAREGESAGEKKKAFELAGIPRKKPKRIMEAIDMELPDIPRKKPTRIMEAIDMEGVQVASRKRKATAQLVPEKRNDQDVDYPMVPHQTSGPIPVSPSLCSVNPSIVSR
jgi:hypothetical protein